MCLFADNMILHVEILKTTFKKLLEVINELNKVAGYKIKGRIKCK